MPAPQPFTALCQSAAGPRHAGRADLHIHTTFSDGTYTPAQVVDLAKRSGLAAIAITDHDTLGGVVPAQEVSREGGLEVIPGVEITSEWEGRELHLLGYFFRLNDAPLLGALDRLRAHRTERFQGMIERLHGCGVSIQKETVARKVADGTLGRRHLAAMLVQERRAGTVKEAFSRYLSDGGRIALPKLRLPVAEAISLVRGAGGVASWAHPAYDANVDRLRRLRDIGLQAVEVEYPSHRQSWIRELHRVAKSLGLAVTGGSDCHGPDQPARAIGSHSIDASALASLRKLAG